MGVSDQERKFSADIIPLFEPPGVERDCPTITDRAAMQDSWFDESGAFSDAQLEAMRDHIAALEPRWISSVDAGQRYLQVQA